MTSDTRLELEEYEWLKFGEPSSTVTASQFGRFTATWKAITGREIGSAFEFGAGRARPTNWLGTMSAAGLTLQVAPRGSGRLPPEGHAVLDSNVGDMLRVALGHESLLLSDAPSARGASRLDRALDAFCELILRARRVRVLRRYRARQELTRSARGSLRFPDQALVELVRPGFVKSRWVELDEDLPENRFLKAVLVRMRPRAGGGLRRRLDDALVELDRAPPSPDPMRDFALIRFERLPMEYVEAIMLGKDLLEGRGLGLFAGAFDARSEVVFMDVLFQAFVGRLTATMARRHSWMSATEKRGRYLARWGAGPYKGVNAVELLPDAEVSRAANEGPSLLLDAKWKVLEPARSGMNVSAQDVHQMLAYGERLNCRSGALVYPWIDKADPFGGDVPTLRVGGGSDPMTLRIVCVPLLWESLPAAQAEFEAKVADLVTPA
jgi:5-methylcytosine-specific restriction endonuclease McrBC regulatory subunit McrC